MLEVHRSYLHGVSMKLYIHVVPFTSFLAICYGGRSRGSAGSRAITQALLFRVSTLIGPGRHFKGSDTLTSPQHHLPRLHYYSNTPACFPSALRLLDTLFCLHFLAVTVHHARICFHPVGRCGRRREREYRSRRQSWRLAGYGAMVSTAHALHGRHGTYAVLHGD